MQWTMLRCSGRMRYYVGWIADRTNQDTNFRTSVPSPSKQITKNCTNCVCPCVVGKQRHLTFVIQERTTRGSSRDRGDKVVGIHTDRRTEALCVVSLFHLLLGRRLAQPSVSSPRRWFITTCARPAHRDAVVVLMLSRAYETYRDYGLKVTDYGMRLEPAVIWPRRRMKLFFLNNSEMIQYLPLLLSFIPYLWLTCFKAIWNYHLNSPYFSAKIKTRLLSWLLFKTLDL